MQINIIDYNKLNPITGYGKMEIGVTREIAKRGIDVNFCSEINYEGMQFIKGAKIGSASRLDSKTVNLCFGSPYGAPKRGFNALFTMSESDRVGEKWVEAINADFDIVFVCNRDLVGIYKTSGVEIPIYYAPLGLDFPEFPTWYDRTERKRERFVFTTYSYGDIRKGADLAITAFKTEFAKDKNKELWIKCRTTKNNWLGRFEDTQIRIFEGDYTNADWFSMLNKSDAFVFPTRGEGFGLPPREAALTGLPTFATEWLGTGDIGEWGIPIKVESMRPALLGEGGANSKSAQWAMPSVENLRLMMRDVADNHLLWLEHNHRVAQGYLRAQTWEKTVSEIFKVLEDHGYRYND